MLVMQYSPACAAGAAIATKASADSAAADAVIILEIGLNFSLHLFQQAVGRATLIGVRSRPYIGSRSTVTSHFFKLSSVAEVQCSDATLNDDFYELFDLHQCMFETLIIRQLSFGAQKGRFYRHPIGTPRLRVHNWLP
jgi:hypothetical protein